MNTEIKIEKTIAPGETVPRVQICPFGEWPGKDRLQVCDSKAFTQLIADWDAAGAKEVLMDFEHASETGRVDSDTRAAAWISNLAIDEAKAMTASELEEAIVRARLHDDDYDRERARNDALAEYARAREEIRVRKTPTEVQPKRQTDGGTTPCK